LLSHRGRPDGRHQWQAGLTPIAKRLEELLEGPKVRLVENWLNADPDQQQVGEIILLENLRFHPGEESADSEFAERLARWGDVYVNDAFAACHHQHASTFVLPQLFAQEDRAIGFLVRDELRTLDELLDATEQPLVAVLGGAKVSDKIGAVEMLLEIADQVLIGGGMSYTFLQASSHHVGDSIVSEEHLALAARLLDEAGDRLKLPIDHVIADRPDASGHVEQGNGGIPPGWYGMDIGPLTIDEYTRLIYDAATVLWNGPMGKFEEQPFRAGTDAISHAMASIDAVTIVGGGETGDAVEQFGVLGQMDHVSTGGAAFLKYLEDRQLPALSVIGQIEQVSADTT
jgi:phosphoglycerate kinase